MQNTQTPRTPLGTMGDQIQVKQLETRQPTAKELKKAGGQPSTRPLPPKASGFFFKPAEKKVQISFQSEETRQQTMASIETFRQQVGPYMQDRIAQLRDFRSFGHEEKASFAEEYELLRQEVLDTLNQEHPLARELAMVAYADAVIQDRLDNQPKWDDAREALDDLSGGGKDFLVSANLAEGQKPRSDQVRFGRKVYSLVPGFRSNSEAVQVFEKAGRLVRAVYDEAQQYAEDHERTVRGLVGSSETQLTTEELTTGSREGFLYLPIPSQEWTTKFMKDGEPKTELHRRGRGGIAIQAVIVQTPKGSKPQVVLVDGHGGIERDCQRVLNAEVFVTPRSLTSDNFIVPEKLDREKQIAARILHRMIYLGITQAKEFEKRQAEKEQFRFECNEDREKLLSGQTVSPVDFYAGEMAGFILLEWGPRPFKQVIWQGKNKPPAEKLVWFAMALIGRDESGRIGVKDCPERLNGFFAPHREFVPPGQDFSKLGKLGVILRQARELVLRGTTPEKLEELRQHVAEAEAARKAAEVQAQQDLAAQLADGTGETLEGVSIPDPTEGR